MQLIGLVKLGYPKRQMNLVFAEVIGRGAVFQPGQFQQMLGLAVTEEHQRKVGFFLAADLHQPQGLFIEGQAFFQIEDIEVVVGKCKLHAKLLLII